MKIGINYHQNKELPEDKIEISIESKSLSPDVQKIVTLLENIDSHLDVIPLTVNEKVMMIPADKIIAIEVYENELTVYTFEEDYRLRGKLKSMLQRLSNNDFIQISKNTIINLNHLNSLEASFSGNMMAFLDKNLKLTVSRKYLIELKKSLGM